MINLRDFTVGNGSDDSALFTTALNTARTAGEALYCPPGDVTYRIADILLTTRDRILCEPSTHIRGVLSNSILFNVEGSANYIYIEGGQWENCGIVFKHDMTISLGSISSCRFRDMYIAANALVGFDCDAILGSSWVDCEFRCSTRAVQINGPRQSNILSWERCKFLLGSGVRLSDGGSVCNKWSFDGCWFEDMISPPIEILMSFNKIAIVDCYFEGCPGIVLEPPVGDLVRGFVFDGCLISQPTEDAIIWLGSARVQNPRTRDNFNIQAATNDLLIRSDTLSVVDGEAPTTIEVVDETSTQKLAKLYSDLGLILPK